MSQGFTVDWVEVFGSGLVGGGLASVLGAAFSPKFKQPALAMAAGIVMIVIGLLIR